MNPLSIGFLLPHYSQPSKSHLPVAMRILAERGVLVEVIHPSDRVFHVSTVQVDHDLYVLKNTSRLALSLAGALHTQGAAIVNPYPATVSLQDRIITSRILESAGVPSPAAYVVSHPARAAPLLEGGPLVVKPYQGSGDTCVVHSVAELAALPAGKDPTFVQRYHPPHGRDRKIYSIGGQLFGVKKIFPPTGVEGEPFIPTPELCEIARRCGRAFGIDLYGVDIIESEGKPYVVDMCSIPGCRGVPDGAAHLASYLYAAAERAARGQSLLVSRTADRDGSPVVAGYSND